MMEMFNDKNVFLEELQVGQEVTFDGVDLIVTKGDTCGKCYFNFCMGRCDHIQCSDHQRSDGNNVYFARKHDNTINRSTSLEYIQPKHILNRHQIIELIEGKYKNTGNVLYKELLDEIG